jgi:hypothetical protein
MKCKAAYVTEMTGKEGLWRNACGYTSRNRNRSLRLAYIIIEVLAVV